jgi:DNA-binding NtrC family response regulator
VPSTIARKDACYDLKQGEDFKMSNNSFFKGHIEQMATGHTCDSNCQHEQSSFGHKEGVSSMQKIEEFLDVLQGSFKCTDEGVDFNSIVDRFENILILAALARTGWNRNRAAALLKLNRTTLVEKLKKKQLAQPGGVVGGPTVGGPTAPINF